MKVVRSILLALMIMSAAVPLLSFQRDVPAEVDSARRALQGARNDLGHAGDDWGGHRAAAMKHIDAALSELGEAEKWTREHPHSK
jgi:hypothetical protein